MSTGVREELLLFRVKPTHLNLAVKLLEILFQRCEFARFILQLSSQCRLLPTILFDITLLSYQRLQRLIIPATRHPNQLHHHSRISVNDDDSRILVLPWYQSSHLDLSFYSYTPAPYSAIPHADWTFRKSLCVVYRVIERFELSNRHCL